MRRRTLLALAAVVGTVGCGQERQLEAGAAGAMHRDVERVRAAAAAGDRDGALQALDALANRVTRRHDGGELDDADAAGLLDRIDAARRRARREIAEPQPTPEATATATSEPPQTEGKGHDKDKDEHEDEGEGEGGDD